jgi:hypothetical protein
MRCASEKHLKGKGRMAVQERRCTAPTNTHESSCVERCGLNHRPNAIDLVGSFVFYVAGGARLGPGARGALPSASTFSRASRLSEKSGVTMQAVLNSDAGADERGSARSRGRCDTCRRWPGVTALVPDPSGSICRITCRTTTARACVPLGMHSAQTPQRTARSESRNAAEFRRTMGVPAGSCTFRRDARNIAHVSGGKIGEHIHTAKERSRVALLSPEISRAAWP